MKSHTIKKLYALHSWVGIVTGILLFIIAFTGAISVFGRPELKIWANPEIRSPAKLDLVQVEKLIADYAIQVPEAYKEEILVFMPGARSFKNLTIVFEAHSGIEPKVSDKDSLNEATRSPAVGKLFEFDPVSLALISSKEGELGYLFDSRETDMADFIVDFHADLHLGRPIGLLLTGLLGLTLMASIITGIFIHRKILSQLFTFRPHKSFSLMLNDGHKVLGIWGLLFHSTIAFTGAFLGLATVILVPAAAFVSFEGDQDKLLEAFIAMPDPVIQNIAMPIKIADIISNTQQLGKGIQVNSVTIKGYGDASAMAYTSLIGGDSVARQVAVYNVDGKFVKQYSNFGRIEGFSGKVLDLLSPLHMGNFGGIFVKFIWALLGMSTAMLPLTGLMLWMQRSVNAANPKYKMQTYRRFNKLIVGACGGIVLACIGLFPAQLILAQVIGVANVGSIIGWPFFTIWLLSILWPFICTDEKRVCKHMILLGAITLISIMPLNSILTNSHIFNLLDTQHFVSVSTDWVTFIIGVSCLYLLKRQTKPSKTKQSILSGKKQLSNGQGV